MFDLYGGLLFSVHGGAEDSGLLIMINNLLALLETLINQSPKAAFATLLPGISALANLHPLFVHFPIALLSLFGMIELTAVIFGRHDWRQAADWFLYLGTVFAGATVVAGFIAASTVAHGEAVHEIMESHEHIGVSIFLLATFLSGWRFSARSSLHGVVNFFYLGFTGILCLLLVFAADLGGLMVYKYGVAVAAVPVSENPDEHHHDHHQE